MTKFKPVSNKILVRRLEAAGTSASGKIFLPETAQKPPLQGTVLAVGPGRFLDAGARKPIEAGIVPGARVVFSHYAGSGEITIDEEKIIFMSEDDVLCVITGEK